MQVTGPTLVSKHGDRKPNSSTSQSTSATSTSLDARQVLSSTSSAVQSPTIAIVQFLASQLAEQTATASDTNRPAAYVWGFGLFLGIAGLFFVLSLLLPLVGPNLLRIVVQRTYTFRNYGVFWPFVFGF